MLIHPAQSAHAASPATSLAPTAGNYMRTLARFPGVTTTGSEGNNEILIRFATRRWVVGAPPLPLH